MSFRVTYTCAFLLLFCGPFFAHERVMTKNRDESMVSTGFQGSSARNSSCILTAKPNQR